MNTIGVEELDLWSQEAMIYYLIFLVIGSFVTSHVTEALYIIFNGAEDRRQRLAEQRLKRSTQRLKELTNAYSSSGQHEPRTHRPDHGRAREENPADQEKAAAQAEHQVA